MRRIIPTVIAAAAFLAPSTALAQSPVVRSDAQIAFEADPSNPCNGSTPARTVNIVWTDAPILSQFGPRSGYASGMDTNGSSNPALWTLRRCEITANRAEVARMSPTQRCMWLVHETLHLARHSHAEGGIMDPERMWDTVYVPCDRRTTRQRVIDDLRLRHPNVTITCSRQQRGVMRCAAFGTRRTWRYRIRIGAGTSYSVRQLRSHS